MAEKILIVGSGGREHALAWKLAQSSRVGRVYVAPGNGGTALAGGKIRNVALPGNGFDALTDFAQGERVSLTLVGPEAPLAAGIVDAFQAAGLRCFGPSQAAARLEASKAFAKDFMTRHEIPTGEYAVFTDYQAARGYLESRSAQDVVIKASGLAAGKGVILPASDQEAQEALRQIMVARVFGAAGDQVVIEERLPGYEASVLAFSDGTTVVPMPAAQDHKRALDGDRGPNTGGMGAFAPSPRVPPGLLRTVMAEVLQPAVDGLHAEGTPYVGVLYAGLMISDGQPWVLEFNCRFGDPETQVILPLLASDLLDVVEACLDGSLRSDDVHWRSGAAATVVAASEGYPGSYPTGREIGGVGEAGALPGVTVFHAGTRLEDGKLLTGGGRVLAVTAVGEDLSTSLDRAYTALSRIHFDGMHYRTDIGRRIHR